MNNSDIDMIIPEGNDDNILMLTRVHLCEESDVSLCSV